MLHMDHYDLGNPGHESFSKSVWDDQLLIFVKLDNLLLIKTPYYYL